MLQTLNPPTALWRAMVDLSLVIFAVTYCRRRAGLEKVASRRDSVARPPRWRAPNRPRGRLPNNEFFEMNHIITFEGLWYNLLVCTIAILSMLLTHTYL